MSAPQPPSFQPPSGRRKTPSGDEAPSARTPSSPSSMPPAFLPGQGRPQASQPPPTSQGQASQGPAAHQPPQRRSVMRSKATAPAHNIPPLQDQGTSPERRSVLPTAPAQPSTPPAFAPASLRRSIDEATAQRSPQGVPSPPGQPGYPPHSPAPSQYARQGHLVPPPAAVRPAPAAQAAPRVAGPQGASTYTASSHAVPGGARPMPRASVPAAPRRRPRRRGRLVWTLVILAALIVGWPAFLMMDANANLGRVNALSPAADTPGTTFLLAGSDSRADGPIQDDTEGARADSIMLVHIAPNGQEVALSLPRDTWVEIPGYGENKLNAAYALEGPSLLVSTVEGLTGLKVDHYVEVGMGGVANIVDAVGGVELCLDYDVDDSRSELKWTAGCHVSDGRTALAFARMRYADPLGDIGRAERQRQVVSKTVKAALSPTTVLWPPSALALERAGAGALTVDPNTGGFDILTLVRAFRSAGANGMTGTPPIVSLNYETSAGSAVLLEDETAPEFFSKLREGTLAPTDLQRVTP